MLTMDPEKLNYLIDIATKTVKQLFQGAEIDFQGRGYAKIENSKCMIDVAIYDDQEIPSEKSIRCEIKKWSPYNTRNNKRRS